MNPFTPKTLDEVFRLADSVAACRYCGITSPDAAVILMGAAASLGFEPIQGLAGMRLIDNRPCPSADMLVAACLRSQQCERFIEVESSETKSTWETSRAGIITRESFSIDDAKKAGLIKANKPDSAWNKYPRKMLSARAKAALARLVYPDLCFGMYIPEEIESGASSTEQQAIRAVPDVRSLPPMPMQALPPHLQPQDEQGEILVYEDSDSPPPRDALDDIREATSIESARKAAGLAFQAGAPKEVVRIVFDETIARLNGGSK
jgi:hypothetical protein